MFTFIHGEDKSARGENVAAQYTTCSAEIGGTAPEFATVDIFALLDQIA
jgi:hypothetical protein